MLSTMRRVIGLYLCTLVLAIASVPSAAAQTQCGYADEMEFPVDLAAFQVVQDFGAASYWAPGTDTHRRRLVRRAGDQLRHGGARRCRRASHLRLAQRLGHRRRRDHPGAHLPRRYDRLQPAWGDITDETGIAFPAVFSCVRLGDPLAAIGDARPAPHLHFEICIDQPGAADVPGAGYVWGSPAASGFRRPTKFLLNFRARAADGYRFTADIADEAGALSPPVVRFGNGLLTLDANRVLGISADGRVLWRTNLDCRAVALLPDRIVPDGALIVYADGGVQPVNPDGGLGGTRSAGVAFTGSPVLAGSQWIFDTGRRSGRA